MVYLLIAGTDGATCIIIGAYDNIYIQLRTSIFFLQEIKIQTCMYPEKGMPMHVQYVARYAKQQKHYKFQTDWFSHFISVIWIVQQQSS